MKISVSELQHASEILFDHLLKNGITQVELSEDYYWDIPEEYMYDVAVDPKEMGTVQLTDDWERIQKKMSKKMGPVSLDLIPFAMLLRRIGETAIC